MTTVIENVDASVSDGGERRARPPEPSPAVRPAESDPVAQRRLRAELVVLERRRNRLRAT